MKRTRRFVLVALLPGIVLGCSLPGNSTRSTPPSSAKALTAFSFANPVATGTIVATNVSVSVPYGTDATVLVAIFSTSAGAKVSINGTVQTSGVTPNNFSTPVVYTVTAEDGSSQNYAVSVTVQSSAMITSFSFPLLGVTGKISGYAITANVPLGTDVSTLIASFTTNGGTVTVGGVVQTSGITPNNFSIPLTYIVTNQGATCSYTLTVIKGSWTTYTTTNGLASNQVNGSFVSGASIYAATAFGLSVSTNSGSSWTTYTRANGLGALTNGSTTGDGEWGVSVSGSTIAVANYACLAVSTDSGSTWTNYPYAIGLGGGGGGYEVSIFGTTIYLAATVGLGVIPIGATTMTGIPQSSFANSPVHCFFLINNTIYVGTGADFGGSGGVWSSTNGGSTWTELLSLGSYDVSGLYVVGNTIFAATMKGLYISANGGSSWTNYLTSEWLSSVYVQNSTIWTTSNGPGNGYGLSTSSNGGTTWTQYTPSDGLGSYYVNDIFVSGSTVYLATTGGLSIGN